MLSWLDKEKFKVIKEKFHKVRKLPPGISLGEVLDSLPFYVMLVDEEHRILFANRALRHELGVDPDRVLGSYCPETVHGLREPYPGCPLEEAVAKGHVAVEKEFFEPVRGRWIRSVVYPTGREVDGKRVYVHLAYDITERKRMEEKIAEQGEHLKAVFNSVQDGIMVIGQDYTITDANPAACEFLGVRREEVVGRKCYEIRHGRDAPCPREICPIHEVFRTGKPAKVVHEHTTKRGSRVIQELILAPVRNSSEVVQVVEVSRDVTERVLREREGALLRKVNNLLNAGAPQREIFDAITRGLTEHFGYKISAITLYDRERNVLEVKSYSFDSELVRMIEELTGVKAVGYIIPVLDGSIIKKLIDRKEAVITADIVELIRGHTDAEHIRTLAPAIAKLIGVRYGIGVPLLAGDKLVGTIGVGSERELTRRDAERLARFGRQAGLAVERAMLYEDLERAYRELQLAYNELKELHELKSNIIANVSHELRTPITIAKGTIELAKDERNEEERNRLLDMALNALLRQNLVVADLLEAAKLEEGGVESKLEMVEVRPAVDRLVAEFMPMIQERKLKIEVKVGRDVCARTDPKHFVHVLRNLISNAVKFNRRGGKIVIEARRNGDKVEVCISDTGIGIPGDKLDKIFERFYQVDSSLTRRYGGTGMGLAIVKELVEVNGGEVWVSSKLGEGSRFCFTLPAWGCHKI